MRWSERRSRYQLAFRAATLSALVLALAGLRWPGQARTIQLVAAFDLSASVYDHTAADGALADLATAVETSAPELAVTVFGRTPALERALAKLPPRASPISRGRRNAEPTPADPTRPPLPDLGKPRAAIDAGASDYGAAIEFARGQFRETAGDLAPARAIVLVGDGLDTEGRAALAAEALNGSGIDMLPWPLALGGGGDLRVDGVRLPERAQAGRGLNIEVTVAGQKPGEAVVRVGRWTGDGWTPVGNATVMLAASGDPRAQEFRATARIPDHLNDLGVAQYLVTVPPGIQDYKENNVLHAAVRVEGPKRWAVLARKGSTLERWFKARPRSLGVEGDLFTAPAFPLSSQAYRKYAGVLVDGLAAQDLPPDSSTLRALSEALRSGPTEGGGEVHGGLALVAVGSESAFGAGEHPMGGVWESLLPVTFRPEEDRTRTILFLLDISSSMKDTTAKGRKIDYAREQLGLIVRPDEQNAALRPTDRIGLVAFSGAANVAAAISGDASRGGFIDALNSLKVEDRTDLLAAFRKASQLLEKDDAEERLVVMLSDGVDTAGNSNTDLDAAVQALCPEPAAGGRRRTTFFAFGIGVDEKDTDEKGAEALKRLTKLGGGAFYPEFFQFAERLKRVFEEGQKDLYTRHESFHVRVRPHPVLTAAGSAWPALPFRNRLKARTSADALVLSAPVPGAETSTGSRKPDPILMLGRLGASRTAVLALALEGEAGEAFLTPGEGWKGGHALLAALLSWAEGRDAGSEGWRIEAGAAPRGRVAVTLYAEDPKTAEPSNGLKLTARLMPLGGVADATQVSNPGHAPVSAPLLPEAPGRYACELAAAKEGVYRLEIEEAAGAAAERFITVPYPAEFRRFGTDRNALSEWADRAGGTSRMINLPAHDLADWISKQSQRRSYVSMRSALILLAAIFLLCEIAARGMRARRA